MSRITKNLYQLRWTHTPKGHLSHSTSVTHHWCRWMYKWKGSNGCSVCHSWHNSESEYFNMALRLYLCI